MERAFANELFLRRLIKLAHLDAASVVFQYGVQDGSLGLLLAQTLSCKVVVADPNAAALESVASQAEALSLRDRVELRHLPAQALNGAGSFSAVICARGWGCSFEEGAQQLRGLLGKDGRLCWLQPVRVGLGGAAEGWRLGWEKRLGEPLSTPASLLVSLERAGFEPETVEAISDAELEAVFRVVPPAPEVLPLFQVLPGHPRATYAAAIGRRKEPGEKPPVSGDRG
jgi:hypothetical protein